MNDKRRPARNAAAKTLRLGKTTDRRRWSGLDELERERHRGVDPRWSRLWPKGPDMLKRNFCYGYVDAESYWNELRRWLEWEEGRAA